MSVYTFVSPPATSFDDGLCFMVHLFSSWKPFSKISLVNCCMSHCFFVFCRAVISFCSTLKFEFSFSYLCHFFYEQMQSYDISFCDCMHRYPMSIYSFWNLKKNKFVNHTEGNCSQGYKFNQWPIKIPRGYVHILLKFN